MNKVAAVEPADIGWKLAAKRLAAAPVPVERSGLDGQSLPFPNGSFDAALSTWTMCTIPDLGAALGEAQTGPQAGRQAALHRAWARP